jgi:aubergine-like protein
MFYSTFYNLKIENLDQPLLEAYSEKDSEKVYLVPELCMLTGVTWDMRRDWSKAEDKQALDALKVKPDDRIACIKELANNMSAGGKGKVLEEWNMSLEAEPMKVSAHTMEPLEVDLGSKKFLIEDGNFQRWMRNGVQAASTLSEWLLLFTERDTQVLDIWLRSLKDIAEVAFQMKLEFPQKIVCTDQLDPETGAVAQLKQRVTANTQLVLLLSPSNIINRVYDEVKSAVTGVDSEFPVTTQIVSSETIRKRSQIASVLSCIALQMNAKCCGPLWQIQLEHKLTEPFFASATMVIGVDVYTAHDGGKWLGFAASLDTHCTEYWSMAYKLDGQHVRRSISEKLQEAMKNSFGTFSQRNNRVVPDHILIYRCSVRLSEEEAVVATEVKAVLGFLGDVNAERQGQQYSPKLTFVAVTNSEGMRFFRPAETGTKCLNPDLGTVVDCPSVSRSSAVNFWLINQTASKGTVTPSHYTVWYDSANTPPSALQHITHRLSFLYFNIWMSVRLPAPAMYAKKLAKFIGRHVKQPPHPRFATSLFYL